MAGSYAITVLDYGRERGTMRVRGIDLTAGNFAAQSAAAAALLAAVEGVIIGNVDATALTAVITDEGADPPESKGAQREVKWLVKATDSVNGRSVRLEIPTADLELLDTNSERMDPDAPEYAALVAALEAYGRSVDGNAFTVDEIVYVSRNT